MQFALVLVPFSLPIGQPPVVLGEAFSHDLARLDQMIPQMPIFPRQFFADEHLACRLDGIRSEMGQRGVRQLSLDPTILFGWEQTKARFHSHVGRDVFQWANSIDTEVVFAIRKLVSDSFQHGVGANPSQGICASRCQEVVVFVEFFHDQKKRVL